MSRELKVLEVLNPAALVKVKEFQVAKRPNNLSGTRIGLLWNVKARGDIALNRVAELLKQRFKNLDSVRFTFPIGAGAANIEKMAKSGCQVFVASTADWGSCTSWLVHDCIELEKRGFPTVVIGADSFLEDARATADSLGMEALPVVMTGAAFTSVTEEEVISRVDKLIDDVVLALTTTPRGPKEKSVILKVGSPTMEFEGKDLLEAAEVMNKAFLENSWGDGFPIIPPTRESVARMLTGTSRQPDEVVAILEPGMGLASVEKIAINAVMAGCAPGHLPVLIAAVEAIAEPRFNLRMVAMSTSPGAPLLVINGPIAKELKINSGRCALGPGAQSQANTVIGRALRLILMNIGKAYPGIMDMDTIGSPIKYSMCIAENEERNPWQPFHVEQGYDKETSTVTAFGIGSLFDTVETAQAHAEGILTTIANTINGLGFGGITSYLYENRFWHNVVLMCPDHAAIIASDGWSKSDIKRYLYEYARLPWRVVRNREPFIDRLAPAWRWLEKAPDELMLPITGGPDWFHIVVVGGPVGKGLYCTGNSIPVTKEIRK